MHNIEGERECVPNAQKVAETENNLILALFKHLEAPYVTQRSQYQLK